VTIAAAHARTQLPARLRPRLACAGRTALYLAIALPLGVLHLLALIPLLVFDRTRVWLLADLERTLANRLLNAHIPPLPSARQRSLQRPPSAVFALLLIRLPFTLATAIACAVPIVIMVELLVLGASGFAGTDRYLGPWSLGPAIGAVLWVLALAAAVVSVAVLDAAELPLRATVTRLLASTVATTAAVREALAERIGDHSLAIAYWLPERSVFVDEHGLPVTLPGPASGRASTLVEHEGQRVAAIIHAAELEARPELVRAAAAGAVLALDNERLKAELRARIEELRASRARIVEATFEARRALERDLHDGAQQQLVALSLDLRMLRNRVGDDDGASQLADMAIEKLATALTELRELARGLHPAVLTDRGLPAALEALAARAPLPVELDVTVHQRLNAAVEAAAYFVAAEALTNVAKYAAASHAKVSLHHVGDEIELEVMDDGIGGADPLEGTGLRGIGDRVAGVDGELEVRSAPGGGTSVIARLPAPGREP
jgi:signal transduction histidine kinase